MQCHTRVYSSVIVMLVRSRNVSDRKSPIIGGVLIEKHGGTTNYRRCCALHISKSVFKKRIVKAMLVLIQAGHS